MSEFETMGLTDRLVSRLKELGLTTPTPIQARAIPEALNGHDVLGLAQTGTGKTAAFGLPLITLLSQNPGRPLPKSVRALILAPTRELAGQIVENLKDYTTGTPIKVALVVGGQSINVQSKRLEKGIDILVATPGRLLDLLDRRALTLQDANFLVLDEADQMLDLGFIHALRKIAGLLPATRQTMLFSATMPKQMNEIANTYLKSPRRIQVAPPGKAADKVTQVVHFIAKSEKQSLLIELLGKHKDERALVFGRTKHGCEKLMKQLVARGFAATSIHGNKSQGQRERALAAFKKGDMMVLVATDVAARGLDIPDVRHVYNYELPNVPDAYVHRIGRTARAGKDGAAIAFCAPDEMDLLKDIEKTMKISIPVESGTPWVDFDGPSAKSRSGMGGGGRGKGGGGRPGGGGGGKLGGKPGGGARRGKPGGTRPQGEGGGGAGGGGGKPGGGRRRRSGGGGGAPAA
ncbi:DEAD/DEAH box helicase [Planktotalea sp.]|uniref:DEAD/DEAH box helicase n=1 Tax=Planktotalea sp. TaxID=2029877 RepID=UPI0025E414B5|nr:DEAD/DEAH box helicase [Planktotalea sp.]